MNTKKIKKIWYCEFCEQAIKVNTKRSQSIINTHEENVVSSRINNNFTNITYTHLNQPFDQVTGLVEKTINEFTIYFHLLNKKKNRT